MILEFVSQFVGKHKGDYYDSRYRQTEPLAFNEFWTYYKEQLSLLNTGKDGESRVKEVAHNYLLSEYERYVNLYLPRKAKYELQQQLKWLPDQPEQITSVIEAATGRVDQLNCVALQHWMWQCKRKLFGLPVVNHLFLMLYEPEGGSGKTTLINRILQPLEKWLLEWNLGALADERNLMALKDNYIVFFDEMAKPDKVSVDVLKHQITTGNNSVRVFRTQTVAYIPQNCTFIGASNKPLSSLIIDDSSMRRFWQITCQEKMDWEAVNAIDPIALWVNIDEQLPEGYLTGDLLQQLRVEQAELKTEDIIDQFIGDMNLWDKQKGDLGNNAEIPFKLLFARFKSYAYEFGFYHVTSIAFGKRAGQKLKIWRTKAERGYYINPAHRLDTSEYRNIDDILGGNNG